MEVTNNLQSVISVNTCLLHLFINIAVYKKLLIIHTKYYRYLMAYKFNVLLY